MPNSSFFLSINSEVVHLTGFKPETARTLVGEEEFTAYGHTGINHFSCMWHSPLQRELSYTPRTYLNSK